MGEKTRRFGKDKSPCLHHELEISLLVGDHWQEDLKYRWSYFDNGRAFRRRVIGGVRVSSIG